MTTVTTNTATPCPGVNGPAVYIIGVVNNSTSAQTCTVTIYDNATAASGTVAASIGPLGISQVITFPGQGIPLQNGATALASAAPNGAGIQILVR
jgi:hypothetical protein